MKDKINILLIEDNPADSRLVTILLKSIYNGDYAITVADSLTNGLNLANSPNPLEGAKGVYDVIILDLTLPDSRGLETFTKLQSKIPGTPIIVLTGIGDETVGIDAVKMGAQDFLLKGEISENLLKRSIDYSIERHKLLQSLAEKNEMEKLATAATQSFNSVIITNHSGAIEWVNEGFTKLTGYTLEEVINTHGEALRRGEQTGISEDTLFYNEVVKHKTPVSYESKNYSKDGKEYWTITTLTPVLSQNGEVGRIIAIDTDITNRKKMEDELEQTMQVKEQFLANMSHEIRTPMNAIIGFTQLLSKTNPSAEQKQYIDIIKTSGANLLVIVNDILDFSKLRSGKISFEKIEFKLPETIVAVTELFLPRATEKKLKISTDIDKKIPDFIVGDPTRLRQILTNLLSNAIKFTRQGEIKIGAEVVKEEGSKIDVMFSISDTGMGIPEDKLGTILEPFTQASSETTRKFGGTGLGLAIVKQLVEQQGGNISVKSKVKEGSEFSFVLAFKKGTGETLKKKTESKGMLDVIPPEGLNVLLVEDNELNAILAEKVLSDWNFKVELADNGLTAFELVKKKNFDIVLMDIQLPGMDGYETTRRIRADLPFPKKNIPVVAMTAHALTGEEDKCYHAGMDGYISKPFEPEKLYKKMLSVVNINGQYSYTHAPDMENNALKHSNLTYLEGLAKGSNEFMRQMLTIFIEQTPEALQKMETALEKRDWKTLRAVVHKMKPSIMFTGLKEIQDDVPLLEEYAATESNLDSIPALIHKIKRVCMEAIEELKTELKKYIP